MRDNLDCISPAGQAQQNADFLSVAILLGTYNGAQYLGEQLNSFVNQTYLNWSVWASDDGSSDNTKLLLQEFSLQYPRKMQILSGPQKGFAANFLSLVCNPAIQASAYAYADQDDIWFENKLERAVHFLGSVPKEVPALYCSRTLYVDLTNHSIGLSLPYARPTGFANALIQNIASGNTMVFNDAARKLLVQAGSHVDIDLHDWWTYILVAGSGGQVYFDKEPSVRYRQHPNNLWGMNTSLRSQILRIKKLFGGRFANWNSRHLAALEPMRDALKPCNLTILDRFSSARKQSLLPRLIGLKKSGVYRQTMMNNIALYLAAIVGRI